MNSNKYRLLVHYKYPQIREGFKAILSLMTTPVSVEYTQLDEEGILIKLQFRPHLIIILMNKGDSDYDLSSKVRLFAPQIPLIVITPEIPFSYFTYLMGKDVSKIIQLPMDEEEICNIIEQTLHRAI